MGFAPAGPLTYQTKAIYQRIMKKKSLLSSRRINRIREQGYFQMSDQHISDLAFGNRFALIVCTSLVTIGVVMANIPILSVMLVVATLGFILPYHPFDYIYNHILAGRMGKPKLPKRSDQLKFACTLATIFILTVIYMFSQGFILLGYIAGGILLSIAITVSSTDFCLPSFIYNRIFLSKKNGMAAYEHTPTHSK
jgi:hypothetical protein